MYFVLWEEGEWAEVFFFMGLFADFPCVSYWPELNHITTPCCKGAREAENLLQEIRIVVTVNHDSISWQRPLQPELVGRAGEGRKKGAVGQGRL